MIVISIQKYNRRPGRSRAARGPSERAAAGHGGSPCPLEVVASQPACYVDCFANKVQTGNRTGLHGFLVESARVHAAAHDFGLFVTRGTAGHQPPLMN